MTKAFAIFVASTVAFLGAGAAAASRGGADLRVQSVRRISALSFEFVGQFQNSAPGVTPPTHIHYGYLAYVGGLTAFGGTEQNETSALFTFSADAATQRVIPNGPLRIVTRVGRLTIYRDRSTNGNFDRPETFRDGRPVLVARFRQQVVTDTVTNTFTTFHQNTIVSTRAFSAGGRTVRLGRVGQRFRTSFSGHVAMPGPPSGFLGGYAETG